MDTSNKKLISYIGLFFVVIVWGILPLVTVSFYKYYSPTSRLTFVQLVLFVTYIAISGKNLWRFNKEYLKVGICTGIFLALADLTQKIGLLYTTPAKYAFLENLSCITVPILMFFFVKKKPTFITFLSCILCLVGVFILNGVTLDGGWGVGELLCGASGLLYGFNIAGTAAFAKKLYAPLYLAVQAAVGFILTSVFTVLLDKTGVEPIFFTVDVSLLFAIAVITVITNAVCWIIRTNTLKHIDATVVAIIMPFSAVITAITSVLFGMDTLSLNMVLGGALGVIAILLASFDK